MLGPRPRLLAALAPPALAAVVLLATAPARAQDLTLVTRELGGWNAALEALRGDLQSEGRQIHVGVQSGSERIACGRYQLELDAAAAGAFRVGGCDPGTRETLLVLEHRAGLFDDTFHVPRPRTLSLTAILSATAVGGGGPQGGSEVHCSWVVRPYLDDLQHGTRVMLTPEHYALRSATASVSAAPDRSGWSLRVSGAAVFQLEYEVTDLAHGDVVLRQKTTLTCADNGVAEEPQSPPPGGTGPVVVFSPVPVSGAVWTPDPAPGVFPGANVCKWGGNRKGCNGSPLGRALTFTIVGSVAAAGATGALYAGSRMSGGSKDNLMIPGILATIVAVGSTFGAAYNWYDLAHPAGFAGVQPTFAVSSRGGALGLGGTF